MLVVRLEGAIIIDILFPLNCRSRTYSPVAPLRHRDIHLVANSLGLLADCPITTVLPSYFGPFKRDGVAILVEDHHSLLSTTYHRSYRNRYMSSRPSGGPDLHIHMWMTPPFRSRISSLLRPSILAPSIFQAFRRNAINDMSRLCPVSLRP